MLWLIARLLRNSVTAGLSSASFCWIASALRYSASASAGLPVCRQQHAEVVVAARQVAAEFGDGGVVVGQLLLDRQRLAVLGLRLRRLARLRQQDAEVVVAAPGAAEFGDGGVVVGQLLRIASALRYSASASAGLPVSSSRSPMRWIVSARSRRASSGPRGRRPAPPGRPAPAGRPPGRRRSCPCSDRSQPSRDRQAASAARAAGSAPAGPASSDSARR